MTRVQAALNAQLTRQNEKLEIELKEKVLGKLYLRSRFMLCDLISLKLLKKFLRREKT